MYTTTIRIPILYIRKHVQDADRVALCIFQASTMTPDACFFAVLSHAMSGDTDAFFAKNSRESNPTTYQTTRLYVPPGLFFKSAMQTPSCRLFLGIATGKFPCGYEIFVGVCGDF